jgi:hypothetical protein
LDHEWARIVCGAEFARRGTHGWPPRFELDERWSQGLLAEAAAHGGFNNDPGQIAQRFNGLVEMIEGLPMYEVLETNVLEINPNSLTAATKGDGQIGTLLAQGWQIASVNQDASNHQRVFIVLERGRVHARAAREIPRLQARLEMQGPLAVHDVTPLHGILRNVGAPASYVRIIIPGIEQD